MRERVEVEWEQVMMSGKPLPHWLARLSGPPRSVIFASVSWTLQGTWIVNVSPKRRGLESPIFHRGAYLTGEKAMSQAQRWASYHGHKVPVS